MLTCFMTVEVRELINERELVSSVILGEQLAIAVEHWPPSKCLYFQNGFMSKLHPGPMY